MRTATGLVMVVLLAVLGLVGPGCGKEETRPNPKLKVPDVPPGSRGDTPIDTKDKTARQD